MSRSEPHIPGRALTPEPPVKLCEIADSLSHPDITKVGLTTTNDGQWALQVFVKPGTPTPLDGIEGMVGGFSVFYKTDPDDYPIARPAYPALGD